MGLAGLVAAVALSCLGRPAQAFAQENVQKVPQMRCGKCPDGFALTGVTSDKKICPDEESYKIVECTPLGQPIIAVCGSCPEGYVQIGGSTVPARCGTENGGRMNQCQLPKMEGGMPDASKGGIFCPPNCAGSTGQSSSDNMKPQPKYQYVPPPSDKK